MNAPFPFFGGKRTIAREVWSRLGTPKQYIEPFCGSAAVLLAAPSPASLEVIGDMNGFIANFWRAVIHQAAEVARWADYPVSHIDLGARHRWLMEQRERIGAEMQDPDWPGDAKVAGWWLWGQCCWIGSGWCEWDNGRKADDWDQIPHVNNAGRGIQASGKIPHISDAGMGIQASGQIPHVGESSNAGTMWTSGGETAMRWLSQLSRRLERVRVVHGDWSRCLNHHYGGDDTAVFLDPPYEAFEGLYRAAPVAQEVAAWCRENAQLRVALCGHRGDYDLPGWSVIEWDRGRLTYGSDKTTAEEAIWFSPACIDPTRQHSMFPIGAESSRIGLPFAPGTEQR